MLLPLGLFLAAFAVRAAFGALFSGPAYPDSYYYVNVAQQLAAGNGFQVEYIWSFVEVGGRLPEARSLPIPSNAHWMPLASIIQVPFIWLLGDAPLAFGLPFWLVGAAAAPLTWFIGRDAGLSRHASVAAALMVAVPGGMTTYFSQPDNFGLYVTLGALALWLCGRSLRGERSALVAGGLVVGLATLSRNDGVLLGIPFALVALHDVWRNRRRPFVPVAAGLACAGLFLLVMAPWLLRQLEVFGTISPSAVGGRILWVKEYSELHSISGPQPTLHTFLDQDLGALLGSRINGLTTALGQLVFLPLAVGLTPFAVLGAWNRRRDPAFQPFLIYATLLLLFTALLFAVHVTHGTFLHSAAALLPHMYLLATIGIRRVVEAIAQRRQSWNANEASRFFVAGGVAMVLIGALVQSPITLDTWRGVQDVQRSLAENLSAVPSTERLISIDAGAYRYLSGQPGVITPIDPLPVIEEVMRAYDVRWLVLESAQISPAMEPILNGELQPGWLSRPVAVVDDPQSAVPAGALYAVCFEPTDTRCLP